MKVKIKKLHPNAVIPTYAKSGDAGMDLTVTSAFLGDEHIKYSFGLAFEIPEGYVGLIFPRSSIYKTYNSLSNSVGVIDSGYRGEVSVVMYSANHNYNFYKIGDRAAQLIIMPYPKIEFEEVEELRDSERGSGGFGSTGV